MKIQEFSKKVIIGFACVWFIACALGGGYVLATHDGFEAWLTFVGAPMTAGLVGYFCKAGFENVRKIKNSINERE